MQLYRAVWYLQAGRKCSIIRFFIYIKMCRLWMYVATLMWLIQCNGWAISRISVGRNFSGFGDNLCLRYQDFLPKRTGLCWIFHGMYICKHTWRFCEKMNLTVVVNRPLFLYSLRPFLKRKKKIITDPACCYVLSGHKHWPCICTSPELYRTLTFILLLKAETVSEISEFRTTVAWLIILSPRDFKVLREITNFLNTQKVSERGLDLTCIDAVKK